MRIPECEFVKKWFIVTDSVPHVSLYVGNNWEAKYLGPMMKKAVRVKLKQYARLPRKSQYPLRPDAKAGIRSTIEGLVKAGVLTETSSYCIWSNVETKRFQK